MSCRNITNANFFSKVAFLEKMDPDTITSLNEVLNFLLANYDFNNTSTTIICQHTWGNFPRLTLSEGLLALSGSTIKIDARSKDQFMVRIFPLMYYHNSLHTMNDYLLIYRRAFGSGTSEQESWKYINLKDSSLSQ